MEKTQNSLKNLKGFIVNRNGKYAVIRTFGKNYIHVNVGKDIADDFASKGDYVALTGKWYTGTDAAKHFYATRATVKSFKDFKKASPDLDPAA